MGAPDHLQLNITQDEEDANEANSSEQTNVSNRSKNYTRWLKIAIYSLCSLFGQLAATLLVRCYYDKGGKSQWMGTLTQLAGFPILLPFYFTSAARKIPTADIIHSSSKPFVFPLVYIVLGLVFAADCLLFSLGLKYLPASTFSLISASQLAFNAFFSFFLNSQKFTPATTNSLVILTISSTLLLFQSDSSDPSNVSKAKHVLGLICTISASAGYGLMLSLTQCAFEKIIKRETFSTILNMTMYQSLVATCAALVGLFASGEWKGLTEEMHAFELGKASYALTLTWATISWQTFNFGTIGLILEVSSVFSNVVCVLGLPFIPILAVIVFHDKMHGIKVMALLLACWGFTSYMYQHYIDYHKSKSENTNVNGGDRASQQEETNGE
ncbi:hypothetical protein FEM48_Zijuj01G0171800 [Ziziphus jujuba var. spinosa]|uniref:Probable purine permease n=1 Tax=Ziziphus jujuba var. spinosa TaxID=714518 RepID=A0A978W2I4_ZIZJJ|nr:hypothetical protein FEM48_Zijuj01G0171800 [Ziziphus jujuba var. spinosa]